MIFFFLLKHVYLTDSFSKF